MRKVLFFLVLLCIPFISFSQNKTRTVDMLYAGDNDFISIWHLCEDSNSPEQIIKKRQDFPKDAISLGWDKGYSIVDLSYGGGYWTVIMDKINLGGQVWFTRSSSKLKKTIQEYWDDDYRINDITFGDGLFTVVMSKKPPLGSGAQTWFTRNSVDQWKKTVSDYWDDDYYLIDLAYGDGMWFSLMQKDVDYSSQSWVGRNEVPVDALEQKNMDGQILTSLATNGKYWIGVFSKVKGCYLQSFGDKPEVDIPDKNPSSTGSGSGFAINSSGYIATNHHVIDGANSIMVKGIEGDFEKIYNAKVIVEDRRNDLAIIKVDKWLGEIPYFVNRSTVDLANEVYALGYPLTSLLGDDIKFSDGKIGATTGFENDPTYYQHSAPIQPGNSGGPLFNRNGDIIAINTLRVNQDFAITEGIFFSVKARYLLNLMEDTNIPIPSNKRLNNYSIPEQVKDIKKFVYIIEVK